jgi:hypothetical protein
LIPLCYRQEEKDMRKVITERLKENWIEVAKKQGVSDRLVMGQDKLK